MIEKNLFAFKAGVAAALTAIGAFLGWRGIIVVAWLAAMMLDYISGTMAACKSHEWSSAVARNGIWHKLGMILAVAVVGIADLGMVVVCDNLPLLEFEWPGLLLPLLLIWYILTELGSVLENCVKLGAPIPEFLIKILKIGFKAVEDAGNKITTE